MHTLGLFFSTLVSQRVASGADNCKAILEMALQGHYIESESVNRC